jgi:hypothetical protein
MYQQAGPAAGQQSAGGTGTAHGSTATGADEEVVDAEYEEVS